MVLTILGGSVWQTYISFFHFALKCNIAVSSVHDGDGIAEAASASKARRDV